MVAKPVVWIRVAFHESNGNHENDETDQDNSDSHNKRGLSAGFADMIVTESMELTRTTGIWCANHGLPTKNVKKATLQKCGSEMFLRFSLPKAS